MQIDRNRQAARLQVVSQRRTGIRKQTCVKRIAAPALLRVPVHVEHENVERKAKRFVLRHHRFDAAIVEIEPPTPRDAERVTWHHCRFPANRVVVGQRRFVVVAVAEKVKVFFAPILFHPPI